MPVLTIDSRFCGPPRMGNGGYVCGRLAAFAPGPTVEVTLMRPTRLDRALPVEIGAEGTVVLREGATEIARARAAALDIEAPLPVLRPDAVEASTRYVGFVAHAFPKCFVCGPERAAGDGLRIFPGALGDGREVVAAPWTPDPSLAEEGGAGISPAFVWAALDCPGAFALMTGDAGKPMLLGRLTARVDGSVSPGEACVVVAWRIGEEGRKLIAGSAVYGEDGSLRGLGRAVWFIV
jgi:hypothetical protein